MTESFDEFADRLFDMYDRRNGNAREALQQREECVRAEVVEKCKLAARWPLGPKDYTHAVDEYRRGRFEAYQAIEKAMPANEDFRLVPVALIESMKTTLANAITCIRNRAALPEGENERAWLRKEGLE